MPRASERRIKNVGLPVATRAYPGEKAVGMAEITETTDNDQAIAERTIAHSLRSS